MTGIERLREFVAGISPVIAVCGVTKTSYDREHMEEFRARLRDFLSDIADQIERERACDADTAENIRLIVGGVIGEMERHVSGVEGMEDSPVARWARELREALGGNGRKTANYVSVSAYDLLPEEDRDAVAWVREHGGLEAVRRRWECLSYYADPVPRSCMEKRLARLQRQIDESHAALRRRREIISELNRRACDLTRENAEREGTIRKLSDRAAKQSDEIRVMRDVIAETCARLGVKGTGSTVDDAQVIWREISRRLMPEGMEWPRFEDGEPVRIGDVVSDVEVRSVVFRDDGILLSDCTSVPGWGTWRSYKEPIKRPAPKVLDADGAEIREKRDVWWICEGDERGFHAERLHVETILPDGLVECSPYNGGTWVSLEPSELYVNKPVPASYGKPLREGETVWNVKTGERYVVERIYSGTTEPDVKTGREYVVVEPSYGETVVVRLAKYDDAEGEQFAFAPSQLTHERPVADTWERIEKDANAAVCAYFGTSVKDCESCGHSSWECSYDKARDLVRRARELAERSE